MNLLDEMNVFEGMYILMDDLIYFDGKFLKKFYSRGICIIYASQQKSLFKKWCFVDKMVEWLVDFTRIWIFLLNFRVLYFKSFCSNEISCKNNEKMKRYVGFWYEAQNSGPKTVRHERLSCFKM